MNCDSALDHSLMVLTNVLGRAQKKDGVHVLASLGSTQLGLAGAVT